MASGTQDTRQSHAGSAWLRPLGGTGGQCSPQGLGQGHRAGREGPADPALALGTAAGRLLTTSGLDCCVCESGVSPEAGLKAVRTGGIPQHSRPKTPPHPEIGWGPACRPIMDAALLSTRGHMQASKDLTPWWTGDRAGPRIRPALGEGGGHASAPSVGLQQYRFFSKGAFAVAVEHSRERGVGQQGRARPTVHGEAAFGSWGLRGGDPGQAGRLRRSSCPLGPNPRNEHLVGGQGLEELSGASGGLCPRGGAWSHHVHQNAQRGTSTEPTLAPLCSGLH